MRNQIILVRLSLCRRTNSRRRQTCLQRTLRWYYQQIRQLEREQQRIVEEVELVDCLSSQLADATGWVSYYFCIYLFLKHYFQLFFRVPFRLVKSELPEAMEPLGPEAQDGENVDGENDTTSSDSDSSSEGEDEVWAVAWHWNSDFINLLNHTNQK